MTFSLKRLGPIDWGRLFDNDLWNFKLLVGTLKEKEYELKRLAVFSLMVLASLILAACIGTAQATINPATPTVAVPVTGGLGIETATEPVNSGIGGTSQPETAATPTGFGDQQSAMETSQALYSTPVVQETVTSQIPVTGGTVEPSVSSTPVSGAFASTPEAATSVPGNGSATAPNAGFLRLQALKNFSLMDSNGTNVGQVTDFIINAAAGQVDYIVVSAQNGTVLVPWSAISSVDTVFNAFMFQYAGDRIQNAPAFDANSVNFNQQNWDQDVMTYWNSVRSGGTGAPGVNTPVAPGSVTSQPAANATPPANVTSSAAAFRFSDLVTAQVVTPDFMNSLGSLITGTSVPNTGSTMVLGTVQDAVVNPTTGELPFLLVSINNNIPGFENRLIPVPYQGFQRGVSGNSLYLSITLDMLRNAPNFDFNSIPNSLGSGWDTGILNYWMGLLQGLGTPTPQPTP